MKNILSSSVRNLALIALALSFTQIARADNLISYNFFGSSGTNPQPSTSNASSVTAANLVLGSGLSLTDHYTDVYAVTPDETASLALAESGNDYIGFTVTPTTGNMINLTNLAFEIASFGGPTTLTLTDSSENVLGSVVAPESANNGTNAYPGFNEPVSLNLTTGDKFSTATSFRLYIYGSSDNGSDNGTPDSIGFNSTSAAASQDSFVIQGTASPLLTPEPSTYALLGLGALTLLFARRLAARS